MNCFLTLISFCAATASSQYNDYTGPVYEIQTPQQIPGYFKYPGYPAHPNSLTNPAYPLNPSYPSEQSYLSDSENSGDLSYQTTPIIQTLVGLSPFFKDVEYPLGYPIIRSDLKPNIPPYTSLLKSFDNAFTEIDSHFTRPAIESLKTSPRDNPLANYIMILNSVNHLIDQMVKNRGGYDIFYKPTVAHAIGEAKGNPLVILEKIKARMNLTASQIIGIRDLITENQQYICKHPISYACDMKIDEAVMEGDNPRLKLEAELLSALRRLVKNFLVYFSTEFDLAATAKSAECEAYLKNGAEPLRMLVVAGFEARQISNDMLSGANSAFLACQGLRTYITIAINVIFMVLNHF